MSAFVHHPALETCWYPVAESADIAGAARPVRLLAKDYVLWRGADGSLVAAPDRCPHREAPLSIGEVKDGVLTCAYHGWAFAGGGVCVEVPSSGSGAAIPPTAHLPCVTVEERYGLVWLCPGEPAKPLPVMTWDDDPAFRRINTGMEVWAASAPRMTDNFMDISHFPWVHTGTFGGAQDPVVPKIDLAPLDDDFYGYAYEVDAANPEDSKKSIEPPIARRAQRHERANIARIWSSVAYAHLRSLPETCRRAVALSLSMRKTSSL